MKRALSHLSRLTRHVQTILSGGAVEQFGALCVRGEHPGEYEVLLITTRETGRWTIPKGWPIKGLSPHEVAEREAWEEAGVKGRAKKRAFGYYTYIKALDDGSKLPSVVEVHLVQVKRTKKRFPERRQRKLAWMAPAEAASMVAEPELKGLLSRVAGSARESSLVTSQFNPVQE
ncbi:NUDIX hydrolase [Ensifer adhaerens]|uniref:NUDIX hydrolase n=1 Tax=Ensifer adhaerens TaxID=106592 RepID=UPI003CEC8F65